MIMLTHSTNDYDKKQKKNKNLGFLTHPNKKTFFLVHKKYSKYLNIKFEYSVLNARAHFNLLLKKTSFNLLSFVSHDFSIPISITNLKGLNNSLIYLYSRILNINTIYLDS